ncbi:MAG: BatD family protein [Pseudomonadota bacterium]|nr:BatD family protein [Pseudomonadota bacterium]
MVNIINVRLINELQHILLLLCRVFIVFVLFLNTGFSGVIASVDRTKVELNETFTLKVIVDTEIDLEPDASGLEGDFYVGSRSQLSNTTIINGKISRSRTWTYALMAKRPGNLVIPSIIVGNEKSQPINILIAPQSESVLGEADVFVSAEVDDSEGFVQAQNLFRIKIYRMVQTRQPRLYEPEIKGIDTLVEIVGDDRNYESVINGKTYEVTERVYALFPQESGVLSIAPIRFEARILKDGSITGRRTYQSSELTINILPIPAPPNAYPDANWLPAKSVKLTEEWSRDMQNLRSGEPITRKLTITAIGQLSTQLPSIDYSNDRLKIYPDKPKFLDDMNADGMIASRIDQYAMISVNAGDIQLSGVDVPWWDTVEKKWKVATLPTRVINIKPSIDDLVEEKIEAGTPAKIEQPLPEINDNLWKNISGILGALWILTIFFWFYSKPVKKRTVKKTYEPLYKKLELQLRKAKNAALANEQEKFKQAFVDWARLQWPDNIPLSLGEVADRVDKPLSDELKIFNKITYGSDHNELWDGKAMAKAIKKISFLDASNNKGKKRELPALAPN